MLENAKERGEMGRAQLNQLVLHFDYMRTTTSTKEKKRMEEGHSRAVVEKRENKFEGNLD